MGGGLGRVSNHPEYYISDGSVSFLVGSTLFRVHRSFMQRESEVFRDLFASTAEDDPPSGTDSRPFTLSDVTADEFAQFLWVWYDGEYSYGQQTKENWITILRLSKRWAFPKIRDLAVRELDALDLAPAQRISIYNEHGIEGDRLLSSYVELCRSPTLPTRADGNLLRMETLINLLQAREDAQRKAMELGHESPTSASLEDETLREIVTNVFSRGLVPWQNGTSSTGSGAQAPNLNRERTQGTSTITLDEPRVPDRKTTASGQSSQVTGSEGKGNQEKERENQAQAGEGDKRKPAEVAQDKQREEKEKRKKAKEEKQKEETARQAKETEEREKAEKAKEAKKKEEEARKKADEQKPPTPRHNPVSQFHYLSLLH
ncbi:hypothetical protein HD554DRAFT_2096226 [Boletus coccyginus]|nr:hypothetical protein HD554DRAFT_2096226 [Boletus coccyginus]